ncbi:MAG: SpoVG family protein [Bacteroidetes bacterium]|nr:SpoVG family protein [Bacteroidota bacterium]
MKITRMHPLNNDSKTAAFFDLETSDNIVIKGFTLIKGVKGLFVGVPSEKGKDDKYYEQVLIPNDMKKELNDMAVKKYDEVSMENVL